MERDKLIEFLKGAMEAQNFDKWVEDAADFIIYKSNQPQDAAMDILRRLVDLKEHKDKYGKDDLYKKEQPILWDIARRTINSEPPQAEPNQKEEGKG